MRRAVLLVVLALVACHRPAAKAAASAKRIGPAPAKIVVTKERKDLVFTWVDAYGKFHDTTKLDDIPADSRAQVLVRDLSKSQDELHTADYLYVADLRQADANGRYPCGAVSRYAFETHGGASKAAEHAAKGAEARGEALVTIYGASWCGACQAAKAWLKKQGVPFIDKDVEKDPGAQAELEAKAAKAGLRPSGIPVIDVAGELMVGFDPDALHALLEKKGLARTL